MEEETNPLKKTARLAGLLWLLVAVTTGFSLGYVRSTLLVSGNAAATANNIMANESLFRMAIASTVFSQIFLFFFGLTAFRLFKGVNKTWATVFLTSVLITVAIGVVNSLNNMAAVLIVSKPDYLNVFAQEQLNAIMMVFLRLNNYGIGLVEIFSAIFLFSFGLLIIKSKYMPNILGVLLIIGSISFPVNTFTKIIVPQFYPTIFTQIAMFCGGLGAIPAILWLLIKGVKEQQQISEI
jgi:signal transduction histidine kinase